MNHELFFFNYSTQGEVIDYTAKFKGHLCIILQLVLLPGDHSEALICEGSKGNFRHIEPAECELSLQCSRWVSVLRWYEHGSPIIIKDN